jgi:iron complex transport system ATP-binding protein
MRLEVRGLSVTYGAVKALKNIDLRLKEGVNVLIGPNGAGKSTLLKALACIVPYEGAVVVDGHEISSLDPSERMRVITYIPPYVPALPDVTVGDLLLVDTSVDRERLNFYAAFLDLNHLLERRIWEVSSGELERALIARGLSRDSAIYAVDEPLAHTDIRYQVRVLKELKELAWKEGKVVIVASNQLNPIMNFADYVIALKSGELFFSGPLEEFLSEELITKLYGVKVKLLKEGSYVDVLPIA